MPYLTPVPLASLPAAGLPASAIDALGSTDVPARMTKRKSYNAVEFAIDPSGTGSGDYALFVYWPDSKSWRPEGPRGATPATYDTSSVAGQVPIRVSMKDVACEVCVVLCSDTGITHGYELSHVEIQEQNR